jgi:hypothetical protein
MISGLSGVLSLSAQMRQSSSSPSLFEFMGPSGREMGLDPSSTSTALAVLAVVDIRISAAGSVSRGKQAKLVDLLNTWERNPTGAKSLKLRLSDSSVSSWSS